MQLLVAVLFLLLVYRVSPFTFPVSEKPYTITRNFFPQTTENYSEVFDDVATLDKWDSAQYGTYCGPASSAAYTDYISNVLSNIQMEGYYPVVIDVSAGDLPWQLPAIAAAREKAGRVAQGRLSHFPFVALDVSPVILSRAMERAKDFPNIFIDQFNMVVDRLHVNAGVVLCRDTIQHMPLADGLTALKNIANSGASTLILGGYLHAQQNWNIRPGDYYLINPTLPPFSIDRTRGLYRMEVEDAKRFNNHTKYLFYIDLHVLRQDPLYQIV
ncbi:MAG: hypothetical protein JSS82_07825 [Bacteroidetes bacterium]|nr:hypothetical protein [Bacteroidota bacterium]